jgi:hypothetical protein
MERQIVLASAFALASICACWLFLRPVKRPPFSSATTVAVACVVALLLISMGLINLFYGFRDGEMYSATRFIAHKGWFAYQEDKTAFAYLGMLYSLSMFFGVAVIRLFLFASIRIE